MIPIFTPLVLGLLLLLRPLSSIYPLLFSKTRSIDIPFHNDELTGARFWALFVYFIFSSLARRVGLVSSSATTDISVRLPFRMKREDVDLYRSASGATCSVEELLEIPAHLQLFLSALTEPAMLVLLAKRGCPIDPIGAVNVRNRFEIPDFTLCTAALREPSKLYIAAALSEDVVQVKRGWEYSIIVELKSKAREGPLMYRQTFTMLQFAKHRTQPPPISQAESIPTSPISQLQLSADDPTLWARLSKDFNPIHISAFAARLLGFRTKIAHGNHVVARAVESVLHAKKREDMNADTKGAGNENLRGNEIMEVDFKRPSFVPCDLAVKESVTSAGRGYYLEIMSREKVLSTIRYGL
ncbi:hypothetical protein IAU59_002544 [Kwoniella sp. CBS 9459]